MNAADVATRGRSLASLVSSSIDEAVAAARAGNSHDGYVVVRQKIEPNLLRELRSAHNDLADFLGMPRMFDGLLDDVHNTRVSGATPEETLQLIVDKLRTTTTKWEIREELPPLSQIIGGLDVPPALETVRTQTLEQLRRNMDRLDGTLRDGFGTYPDYAELGQAIAGSELLLSVHRGTTTTSAARAASEAVHNAAATLTW